MNESLWVYHRGSGTYINADECEFFVLPDDVELDREAPPEMTVGTLIVFKGQLEGEVRWASQRVAFACDNYNCTHAGVRVNTYDVVQNVARCLECGCALHLGEDHQPLSERDRE